MALSCHCARVRLERTANFELPAEKAVRNPTRTSQSTMRVQLPRRKYEEFNCCRCAGEFLSLGAEAGRLGIDPSPHAPYPSYAKAV